MGRKNVIFCDLCKQEAAEDSLSSLAFKKPGKKTINKYELCPSCAEKLQVQLVSESELSSGWVFGSTNKPKGNDSDPSQSEETVTQRRARLAKQSDEDDLFIASKKSEVSAVEVKVKNDGGNKAVAKKNAAKCLHYNRTSPTLGTNVDGNKAFVVRCKDCNVTLGVQSADERHAISSGD